MEQASGTQLQLRNTLNSLVTHSETAEQTQARQDYCTALFVRYTNASGVEIPLERAKGLLNELQLRGFTYDQFQIAEEWILRGNPCRYGTLVLADFYPTEEQANSLGFDITALLNTAKERGEAAGYDKGYNAASREYEQDTERLRLLSETKDQSEINRWKLQLDSREKELETRIEAISEREQKCLEIERIASKRIAFIESTEN